MERHKNLALWRVWANGRIHEGHYCGPRIISVEVEKVAKNFEVKIFFFFYKIILHSIKNRAKSPSILGVELYILLSNFHYLKIFLYFRGLFFISLL
jgi:hypothetical protein